MSDQEEQEMHRLWLIEHKAIKELATRYNLSVKDANATIAKQDEMAKERRRQVDALLEKIMHLKANIGRDSTKEEKLQARSEEAKIVDEINQIDPDFFQTIKHDTE